MARTKQTARKSTGGKAPRIRSKRVIDLDEMLKRIENGESLDLKSSDFLHVKTGYKEEDIKKFFGKLKEMDKEIKKMHVEVSLLGQYKSLHSLMFDYLKHKRKVPCSIKLQSPDEDLDELLEILNDLESIEKLTICLSYYDMKRVSIKKFLNGLEEKCKISNLVIESNSMNKELSEEVSRFLITNKWVTSFGFKFIGEKDEDDTDQMEFRPIFEASKKNQTLNSLLLSNKEDGYEVGMSLKNYLPEILSENKNLKKLELKGLALQNNTLSSLFTSLHCYDSMTFLDFSFNHTLEKSGIELNKMLSSIKSLHTLKLNNCFRVSTFSLKEGLEKNESIRHLELKNNQAHDISYLPELLSNKKWEHLDVKGTLFERETQKKMFDSLKNNQHLLFLNIVTIHTRIEQSAEDTQYCLNCLKSNTVLQSLSFRGSDSCTEDITDLLRNNHSLVSLNFYSESIFKSISNPNATSYLNINSRISQRPCWSVGKHSLFEPEFKQIIFYFLLSHNAFFKNKKYLKIPKPLLFKIFDYFSVQFLIQSKNQPKTIEFQKEKMIENSKKRNFQDN